MKLANMRLSHHPAGRFPATIGFFFYSQKFALFFYEGKYYFMYDSFFHSGQDEI